MRQTTREFTMCGGAWPKGITVGNWREGGCAAESLIRRLVQGYRGDTSSTSTMRSRGGLTSMTSVDSMRGAEPFNGRHQRLAMRQRSMEDIPEGPSKQARLFCVQVSLNIVYKR